MKKKLKEKEELNGSVLFNRKISKHDIMRNNAEHFRLFAYFLIMAKYCNWFEFTNGKKIRIKRGEFILNPTEIMKDLNISRRSFYKFYKALCNDYDKIIIKEKIGLYTKIIIPNYVKWQTF